ncbi:MAG: hypothetical protein L3J86_05135 [Thermoplasmata archaeon]|nr:hypothetical protein [Thermoplasmata archaeon]
MQSGSAREALLTRRARVACPRCGVAVEIVRMRAHLREAHQVGAAELETSFLTARREARRASRSARR